MAKFAGYHTWQLEAYIYFQSGSEFKDLRTSQKTRIITGIGMLEWFREEAMKIINLCTI